MNTKEHYGYAVIRPEVSAQIIPSPPLPWYVAAYYKASRVIDDMKAPAMFAISFVCLKYAFVGHF